jgi:hypothetical protein
MLNWFFVCFQDAKITKRKKTLITKIQGCFAQFVDIWKKKIAIFWEKLVKLVEFTIEQRKSSKIFPTFLLENMTKKFRKEDSLNL